MCDSSQTVHQPRLRGSDLGILAMLRHGCGLDATQTSLKYLQSNMATRSRIGVQLKNGSVLSVYCHWDGYPEWNGKKLNEHFNTRQKAAELVDGGDISSLWTDKDWDGKEQEYGTLYYEGRGDVDTEPSLSDSFQDFIKSVNDSWCDYAYLFTNGEWKCYTPKGNEEKIPV